MSVHSHDPDALRRDLALRDLSDAAQGPHAMQQVLDALERALAAAWGVDVRRHRAHPVVSIAENYDRLGFPAEAITRDARYTRYVADGRVLRTHTSAMIPPLLERLAEDPPDDVLLVCPGLCYRRDVIDRHHTGEPHQVDLWRVRTDRARLGGGPLGTADLAEMVGLVVSAVLPGRSWRTVASAHPYTTDGLQIDVADGADWVEIGECGVAHPDILASAGLDLRAVSALAMGLGLDRLLMLRKGVDDIRLLRSTDPRVAAQMRDLAPYRPVSAMPPVRRDVSVAVAEDASPEELGDRVRAALGTRASSVEAVEVLSSTGWSELPEAARQRLGMRAGQRNVLVRVVLRDLDRTLTSDEANLLRDEIYAALHEGGVHHWARGAPPGVTPGVWASGGGGPASTPRRA